MSSHIGGSDDPSTQELWKYYNGKSSLDKDDLSTFLTMLRKKDMSDKRIREIKNQFEEELKNAIKVAQLVSAKLQLKYEYLSDEDILKKIKKCTDRLKLKLNDGMEHAILENIIESRSKGATNAKFSFRPTKFNAIGEMLANKKWTHFHELTNQQQST